MLQFSGRKVPDNIYVHGFITVSGEKMSKSRGTGIDPLRYLELGMNPEWFRYYVAAKLNGRVEDIEFNPDDFLLRVNSDLIGKYVNIASRAANFISKHFGGQLAYKDEQALVDGGARSTFGARSQRCATSARIRQSLARHHGNADRLNEAFDAAEPWKLAKDPASARRAATRLFKRAARVQAAIGVPGARLARDCKAHCARLLRHRSTISIWTDAETPATTNRSLQASDDPRRTQAARRTLRAAGRSR